MEYGFILGIFFLIMFVLFAIIDGRNDARDLLKRKIVENIDEPKYTDYELELINEIDLAFKSYIENKGILNDNDVAMLNQFVKLNPKTKMKFSYENEKMYNVKFLL